MIVYGIPNCDTVRRSRAWLIEHGFTHAVHDFRKAGVPPERVDAWIAALGWQPLVNRHGTTWRKLDGATQRSVIDAASARKLMLDQPSVIKRPVVDWPDGSVSVGFDAERWAALLEGQ